MSVIPVLLASLGIVGVKNMQQAHRVFGCVRTTETEWKRALQSHHRETPSQRFRKFACEERGVFCEVSLWGFQQGDELAHRIRTPRNFLRMFQSRSLLKLRYNPARVSMLARLAGSVESLLSCKSLFEREVSTCDLTGRCGRTANSARKALRRFRAALSAPFRENA